MELRTFTLRRLAWLTLALLGVLSVPQRAAADAPLLVPIALRGSATGATAPVQLPPLFWSRVLADVPVPTGYALEYYDAVAEPSTAWALYASIPADAVDVLPWYRDVLPILRWRLVREAEGAQQWSREGRSLDVRVQVGPAATELHFTCRPDCSGRADGLSLDRSVPLPGDALRRRYDPRDMFAEELRFDADPADVRARIDAGLQHEGWRLAGVGTQGVAKIDRFARGDERLVVSVRSESHGVTDVGIGGVDCVGRAGMGADWPRPAETVYIADLPAPLDSYIVAYDRTAGGDTGRETWTCRCGDIDLMQDAFRDALASTPWRLALPVSGGPGFLAAEVSLPGSGPSVTLRFEAGGDGVITTTLESTAGGVGASKGTSLLFSDVPIPVDSVPVRLATAEGAPWPFHEVYRPPASIVSGLGAFFRQRMPASAWSFDRVEPMGVGSDQVYFRGGEEVVIGFPDEEGVPALSLSRRRVCASDDAPIPPGEGPPSPNLAEMPVYPGASLQSFDSDGERHGVTCASMDGIAAWYRTALERGDWALASTIGPDDAFRRDLLFVRPDERALPPEQRSAWALVRVERPWPYTYRITLQRDPSGVRPFSGFR